MANFTPDEKVIKILANFAQINPSMLIEPEKLSVVNTTKSVIANYKFPTPYDFEPFALYDTTIALGIINAMATPDIEVKEKFINIIGANDDKVLYFTTPTDLVPKVPNISKKIDTMVWDLDFQLTSDKLAVIMKMAAILKSKFIFFETDSKRIRITLGDELESSGNNYEVCITDGISANNLKAPVKISIIDFKVLAGEYEVKITDKITKWSNLNGVTYFISTSVKNVQGN